MKFFFAKSLIFGIITEFAVNIWTNMPEQPFTVDCAVKSGSKTIFSCHLLDIITKHVLIKCKCLDIYPLSTGTDRTIANSL